MTQTGTSLTWKNWTGDQICHPAAIQTPSTKEELSSALERARRNGWTVRVAGAGHSFTDAVLTDGMILSLDRMSRVLDVDTSTSSVRVEAGITLNELNERLNERGLALENLGDIAVQSLAGATATGTHGTGKKLRNISANLVSIEVMLADGSTVELNESSDAVGWRAARISLGALGVITAMTVRVVPSFTLLGKDEAEPLDAVLERFDDLVENNEHFEFYSFPHSKTAWTRTNNRTEAEPRPRSRSSEWFHERFLVNTLYGLSCRTARRFPKTIPSLNRVAASLAGGGERVDRSYKIFASQRHVRFTESEYSIPRDRVVPVVRAIHRTIEKNGYDVPFPMEIRSVASDDALLSPAFGRDSAYVSVHMFEKMEWEPYFRSVRSIMRDAGGRPHWGKRHFENAESLRPLYPEWDRFAAVRARLDPERRFTNGYVRRVLGE